MRSDIAVIGLGLIGGSLLKSLDCSGYDLDPEVRALARDEGYAVKNSLEELEAEFLIIAVPPRDTETLARELTEGYPESTVMDVSSVKTFKFSSPRFIPAHPLQGAEGAGYQRSWEGLLDKATWALTPDLNHIDTESFLKVTELIAELEGKLLVTSANAHDKALALSSHLPQLLASSLTQLGAKPLLSGGAYRDMTRIAEVDAKLWTQIIELNRENLLTTLLSFKAYLGSLEVAIRNQDLDFIQSYLEAGHSTRLNYLKSRQEPEWEVVKIQELQELEDYQEVLIRNFRRGREGFSFERALAES